MLHRLFKAFESQRAFVRNASHELKTPLALMLGKVEKLVEATPDPGAQRLLTDIIGDVKGQASLIESLLLLQRLQSQVPIQTTAVRIDEILYESIRETSTSFPQQKVEVDIQAIIHTEKQLTLMGNSMLLKTCFRNLIENAAQYSKENILKITISSNAHSLQVLFENAGDESLPGDLIFEPFYRLSKEQEKPGSGLGLSIVNQIVSLMKGTVEYQYEKGKHCFKLLFPYAS